MTPERKNIPEWARRERADDLRWIRENMADFWSMATRANQEHVRGAIVVDATTIVPGAGHLYAYFSQETVANLEDEDLNRLVNDYDPEVEVVVALVKPKGRLSTYRIKPLPPFRN